MSNKGNPFSFNANNSPEENTEDVAMVTLGENVISMQDENLTPVEEDQNFIEDSEDVFIVDNTGNEETGENSIQTPEPEEEETPTEDAAEETTNEVEETEEDDEDEEEETLAFVLAESFAEDGVLNKEELSKDITPLELREKLFNSIRAEALKDAQVEVYREEETIKVLDYLKKGGSLEQIQSAYTYRPLINLPLDETLDPDQLDNNRKALILNMYRDKGISNSRAESFYDALQKTGEDSEEAMAAQAYFTEKEEQRINYVLEQDRQQEELQQRYIEDNRKNVESIIKSGNIGDIKLKDKEQQDFIDVLYKKTEKTVQQGPDGRKYIEYKSKAELVLEKLQQDPSTQLLFIYNTVFNKKASLDKEVNQEQLEMDVSRKILKKLEGTKSKTPKNTTAKRKVNAYEKLASEYYD